MDKYDTIRDICKTRSAISRKVIDEFLLYLVAAKENSVATMDRSFHAYQTVLRELDDAYVNFLKSEFIIHKIFKKGGLLPKYLRHSRVLELPALEREFLASFVDRPWRYSFAEVIDRPHPEFFRMSDVFTGEEYVLYSPGMEDTLEGGHYRLWFNLILFNGHCWQTFGLIIGFSSFTGNDIFFFGTELNPQIQDETGLLKEVEKNPLPFRLLLTGAMLPEIISRGHSVFRLQASDSLDKISEAEMSSHFTLTHVKNVWQLSHKTWRGYPHFAQAYFDEKRHLILRTALTEFGFNELTKALRKSGLLLSDDPDVQITIGLITTSEKILQKKIKINPYESLFKG